MISLIQITDLHLTKNKKTKVKAWSTHASFKKVIDFIKKNESPDFIITSGDISNEVEMESQGERMIRNELTLEIKGYMIPEFTDTVFGKTAEMTRGYKPKKVSFSEKLL